MHYLRILLTTPGQAVLSFSVTGEETQARSVCLSCTSRPSDVCLAHPSPATFPVFLDQLASSWIQPMGGTSRRWGAGGGEKPGFLCLPSPLCVVSPSGRPPEFHILPSDAKGTAPVVQPPPRKWLPAHLCCLSTPVWLPTLSPAHQFPVLHSLSVSLVWTWTLIRKVQNAVQDHREETVQ